MAKLIISINIEVKNKGAVLGGGTCNTHSHRKWNNKTSKNAQEKGQKHQNGIQNLIQN